MPERKMTDQINEVHVLDYTVNQDLFPSFQSIETRQ